LKGLKNVIWTAFKENKINSSEFETPELQKQLKKIELEYKEKLAELHREMVDEVLAVLPKEAADSIEYTLGVKNLKKNQKQ
jgi:hypothetical protein